MAETRTELTNHGVAEDPERLEQEIAKTRSEMAGTINAIQRRLEPERLKGEAERRVEDAMERAKEKVEDATIGRIEEMTDQAARKAAGWRANMMNTIKENPVPAALVGVGLGWLIMEGSGNDYDGYDQYGASDRYPSSYGYAQAGSYSQGTRGYGDDYARYDRSERTRREEGVGRKVQEARREVGQKVDEMGNRVEETVDDLRDRAAHLRDEAMEGIEETTEEIRHRAERLRENVDEQWDETTERARQMRYEAQYKGRQAKRSAQNLLRDNPLAAGAAAVGLGILVGWALPSTETESRMVGPYRDELVDQARHEAQNIAQRAQSVAGEALKDVKEEAKNAANKTIDEVTDESKRAAQRVTENNA